LTKKTEKNEDRLIQGQNAYKVRPEALQHSPRWRYSLELLIWKTVKIYRKS